MPLSTPQILHELYAIDPSLREHEAALVSVIEELLANKPDTKFDAVFAEQLKEKILTATPQKAPGVWARITEHVQKMVLTFAGSAAVVAVALLIMISAQRAERRLPADLRMRDEVLPLSAPREGMRVKAGAPVQDDAPALMQMQTSLEAPGGNTDNFLMVSSSVETPPTSTPATSTP